jgi:outer membrane protein OmpA-like peptidoglycan-associated protein
MPTPSPRRPETRSVSNSAAARAEEPPPGDTQAARFSELRSLLIGPEQRQLHALQDRIEDPATRARDVSRVLATAVELRTNDPHLKRALAPTIEETISASVRRNPRPLADALFPIIGPAIRKAIAATLSGMLESLNSTLEHSLSWRSVRWRLDAQRSGRPFAEVLLLNTLVYRVEQVFLIHRPSGLLLQQLSAPGTAAQDADMVSGMLSAIRDFVQDSFKVSEEDGLQTLNVGELSVWIEQGPHALLAVVVRGTAPPSLRTTLQQALEAAHAQYGDLLERFDGETSAFDPVRPLLETCLQQQFRGRERTSVIPPRLKVFVALALLVFGIWLFFTLRARSRWNGYLDGLRREPGLVVVSSGRSGGKYVVTGLRDPLARDPGQLLSPHGLQADAVDGRWESYQTLHPSIPLARARQLLAAPPGVTLQLTDGVLAAAGTAPVEWIANAVLIAPLVPGVSRFDAAPLVDTAVRGVTASIEGAMPTFVKGTTSLTSEGEQVVREQMTRLVSLDALARVSQHRFAVELIGETDADGAPQLNVPLSARRAERVLSLLQLRPLDYVDITATGVGSRTASDAVADESNKQRNRRVSFRVTAVTDRR